MLRPRHCWPRLMLPAAVFASCVPMGLSGCDRNQEPQRPARADPGQQEEVPDEIRNLIAMLRSEDSDKRESGALLLAERGPQAAPALPDLLPLLEDRADVVCAAAVRATCAIGRQAASTIPAMVKNARRRLLESPDEGVCLSALYNCSFGPEAVPHLVAELGRDPGTDEIPENMLSNAGLGDAALPALEKVLEEDGYRAQSAASVLKRMGPRARPATESLVKAHREGKISDLTYSSAMGEIGPQTQEAIRELERIARESGEVRARDEASRALGRRQCVW